MSEEKKRLMAGGRCLALVTGASRGLGRAICERLMSHLGGGSVLVLTARRWADLEAVRCDLLKRRDAAADGEVKIVCVECDMATATEEQLRQIVRSGVDAAVSTQLQSAIIVHNAGSLGDISRRTDEFEELEPLQDYFRVNLTSVIVLNAVFLKLVRPIVKEISVVNISSLCALKPYPSMSLYCSGKAARDAFFAVLAEEHKDIDVLSYSPGPLVTDMTQDVADRAADPELRERFKRGRQETFLTCETSADRLMIVLQEKKYKSGEHVDYYQEI